MYGPMPINIYSWCLLLYWSSVPLTFSIPLPLQVWAHFFLLDFSKIWWMFLWVVYLAFVHLLCMSLIIFNLFFLISLLACRKQGSFLMHFSFLIVSSDVTKWNSAICSFCDCVFSIAVVLVNYMSSIALYNLASGLAINSLFVCLFVLCRFVTCLPPCIYLVMYKICPKYYIFVWQCWFFWVKVKVPFWKMAIYW